MQVQAALSLLNHLLAQARWARQRLQPHAGRVFALQAGPLSLVLAIDAEGYFRPAPLDQATPAAADVRIQLPAQLPAGLDFSPAALMRTAHIEGNAEFAQTLGLVFSHLRWDVEEDLSRLVGDMAAHRLVQQAQSFFAWQREAARRGLDNLVDYATEERPIVPSRPAFDRHAAALAQLEAQLTAASNRLNRLAAPPQAKPLK